MEDVSVNPDYGGASSTGTSQSQVSGLNGLFMGSQVYEATTLLETGNGSMQLSHFGDGFSTCPCDASHIKCRDIDADTCGCMEPQASA